MHLWTPDVIVSISSLGDKLRWAQRKAQGDGWQLPVSFTFFSPATHVIQSLFSPQQATSGLRGLVLRTLKQA